MEGTCNGRAVGMSRDREGRQSAALAVRALDKALEIQRPLVLRHLARMRRTRPNSSPAEIIRALEKHYLATVVSSGVAVGGAAAAPGVGTAAALALSVGEVGVFLEASVLFSLAIAEVHGVTIDDLERRRTLVLAVILGNSGSATVEKIAQRTGQHWARKAINSIPIETIRAINRVLGRNFVTKFGTEEGIIVLGRVVPFGIGAVIGGGANAALGTTVTRAARRAFGPPPASFAVDGDRDGAAPNVEPESAIPDEEA